MKSKFISKQSGKLLSFFNERGIKCFGYEQAKIALPSSSGGSLRELLRDMTVRGLLFRVKRGIYYIIPYEQDPEDFMPDWHLLSEHLVSGIDFYIGYYSALQIHNLITQPSLVEQVVVSEQVKPSKQNVKDIEFQFIYHNTQHFFGAKKFWINSYDKVMCSDLEKTIIDCLFKPDYAGGIVEIARAVYVSREQINYELLLDYAIKFNSQAVIKRLGFILDLLKIKTGIIESLKELKTNSIVILDTELNRSGKIVSKWSIQQNVDTETIKSALYT
ncbi:MAG: hypothetical protein PHE56_09575 [Bacteroidales bacterium]|jgi:predicted transcriptional regulator of viral defense system|nr:hypothetical protein [Bacteroidales bacterium]